MTDRDILNERQPIAEVLELIEATGWTVTGGPDDDEDGCYRLSGLMLMPPPPGEMADDAPPTEHRVTLRLEPADLRLWWSAWTAGVMHGAQCLRIAAAAAEAQREPNGKRKRRRWWR